MGLFRALMQSLSKQDPCVNQPQLFEFYFCGQKILHLPVRRWTRTSECFAEFTAPVSPLFMPSWHFELLYRLLPFRLFFGVGLVCCLGAGLCSSFLCWVATWLVTLYSLD